MGTRAHSEGDGDPPAPPRDLAAETALLADQAEALLSRLEDSGADVRSVNETIILGLRLAELSAALDAADASQVTLEAAYAQGRADAATDARAARSRRAGHLRVLPSLPSLPAGAVRAAAAAAVVAGLTAGAVAGAQEAPAWHATAVPGAPT